MAPVVASGEEDDMDPESDSAADAEPAAATDGVALFAQPAAHRAELKAKTAPRCMKGVFLPFGCMVRRTTLRTYLLFHLQIKWPEHHVGNLRRANILF